MAIEEYQPLTARALLSSSNNVHQPLRLARQSRNPKYYAIRSSHIPFRIADNDLLVKVHAWAINPADAIPQDTNLPFLKCPIIFGEDIAGTVSIVSSTASSKFKLGDRLLGLCLPSKQGVLQDYVVLEHTMACKIPDSLSFFLSVLRPLPIWSFLKNLPRLAFQTPFLQTVSFLLQTPWISTPTFHHETAASLKTNKKQKISLKQLHENQSLWPLHVRVGFILSSSIISLHLSSILTFSLASYLPQFGMKED